MVMAIENSGVKITPDSIKSKLLQDCDEKKDVVNHTIQRTVTRNRTVIRMQITVLIATPKMIIGTVAA